MATPIPTTINPDLAEKATACLRQQADAQDALNEAASKYLSQMGPPFTDAVKRLTMAMRQLDAEGVRKLQEGLGKLKNSAASTVVGLIAAGAAMAKFSHAANPQLVGALNTQFQTLQAKIGGSLLPMLSSLMSGVDDLSQGFSSLSETEQKVVAGALVAVPAIRGLTSSITAILPATTKAEIGIKALVASLGPLGAALAIGGALASHSAGGPTIEEHNKIATTTGPVSEKEIRDVGIDAGVMSRARIMDEKKRPVLDITKLNKENVARLPQKATQTVWEKMTESNEHFEARSAAYEAVISRIKGGAPIVSNQVINQEKRVRDVQKQLGTASREMQPHYSGLADVRKQLQLGVLGKNPYEQEQLKVQRDNREILRKILEKETRALEVARRGSTVA
jgi:hypothetical protein